MASATSPIIPELPIIRARGDGEQRATFFELFFDLVYVFAVTQLSHHLGASTPAGSPNGYLHGARRARSPWRRAGSPTAGTARSV